jgi:hypothetical protein
MSTIARANSRKGDSYWRTQGNDERPGQEASHRLPGAGPSHAGFKRTLIVAEKGPVSRTRNSLCINRTRTCCQVRVIVTLILRTLFFQDILGLEYFLLE